MATVNKMIGGMDGLMTISLDYDDVALRVLAFHIVNDASRSYTISATSTVNGKNYTFVIPANSVIDQTVPPGASNRLQLSVTPSGKLDGVEWSVY
jgi:hypothetical protein